jgi:kumamolisin
MNSSLHSSAVCHSRLASLGHWILAGLLSIVLSGSARAHPAQIHRHSVGGDSPTVDVSASLASPPERLTRLEGHVLTKLAEAIPVQSEAGADRPLTLTLVLEREDQAGFDAYLRALYDPQSPQFRKFPTQQQLVERFGPSRQAYGQVLAYVRDHGLDLVQGSESHLTLTVRGTRSQVKRAFAAEISDYTIGETSFFANRNDPALPESIADQVQAVIGLSSLATPHASWDEMPSLLALISCLVYNETANHLLTLQGTPSASDGQAAAALVKCLTTRKYMFTHNAVPDQDDPPPPSWLGVDGTGQTIGITAFDTFDREDIRSFLNLTGLPTQMDDVVSVHVNGGAAPGPNQSEVLLDITAVLAIAPGARVVVYDAPFAGTNTSFPAVFSAMIDDGVDIITNSWATCEDQATDAELQGIDSVLAQAAASGISVFNAAGDSGATCLNGSPDTIAVPAGSPHATAVGGSSLASGEGFTYRNETWWDGSGNVPTTGRGGFGTSRFFTRPAYQDGFTASPMRSVPDVSVNADPARGVGICQADRGGCPADLFYGGTSLSAPVWAGFTALLNQSRGSNLGFLNPVIYPLAGSGAFHDPVSLGSDFEHVGLGSPRLNILHRILTGQTTGPVDPTVSLVTPYVGEFFSSPLGGQQLPVQADGEPGASVVVRLIDAPGNPVGGKTVALTANAGSSVVIDPPTGVSDENQGAVVFQVSNLVPETVTFTATDLTDGVVLTPPNPTMLSFVTPLAASGGIGASPTVVIADGIGETGITVTLEDALSRPTPGKKVTLQQSDGGHSLISAPNPSVTDSNGQIVFTATNVWEETVTYSAVDVTDGYLPVPGSVDVEFVDATGTACTEEPPTAAAGYSITPFATGFTAANFFFGGINFTGCQGVIGMAFDDSGNFYAADVVTGGLYKFGPAGGVADAASLLSDELGPGVTGLTFDLDGRLYASRAGAPNTDIVEVSPFNGALLRDDVADVTLCSFGLTTDPLSGDLFIADFCFTGGTSEIRRVSDPGTTAPTTSVYASVATPTANGQLTFAPDGSLFVRSGDKIGKIAGTDMPSPPEVTLIPLDNPAPFGNLGIAIGAADVDGSALSLIAHVAQDPDLGDDPAGITAGYDLGVDPAAVSARIANGQAEGDLIGPDGCLYMAIQDTVYRVTNADGSCDPLAAGGPSPALLLTPEQAAPDPVQGSEQSFTASLRYVDLPDSVPVWFSVTGANPALKQVDTDAEGRAGFHYSGIRAGDDSIFAFAQVDGVSVTSNRSTVTWLPGPHTTFVSLNPSPTSGTLGEPVTLMASLIDVSALPAVSLVGEQIDFTLGDQSCSAQTDAQGLAACEVTASGTGVRILSTDFAGSAGLLPDSERVGFVVPAPSDVLCGDANLDGNVNIVDALWVARYEAELDPQPFGPLDADVHAPSNGVNIVDALLIARHEALLPPLPGTCLQ